jgi:hypothetical protein
VVLQLQPSGARVKNCDLIALMIEALNCECTVGSTIYLHLVPGLRTVM